MTTISLVEIYGGATCLGIFAGGITATAVYLRLVARLNRRRITDATARDLEKRRDAYESGRDMEVRPNAGPAAGQTNLFPVTRPGTMMRRKIDRNR